MSVGAFDGTRMGWRTKALHDGNEHVASAQNDGINLHARIANTPPQDQTIITTKRMCRH